MTRSKIYRREGRADSALLLVISLDLLIIRRRLPAVTGYDCCRRQALFCVPGLWLWEGGGG